MLSPPKRFEISIKFQLEVLKEGKDCVVEHFENVLYVYILCIVDVENSQNVPKLLKNMYYFNMFYDTVFAFLKNLPLELNRYLKPFRRR